MLPVGTVVLVTPHRNEANQEPFRAQVAGYDIHRTKYRLGRECSPGRFLTGEYAACWAFPGQVTEEPQA